MTQTMDPEAILDHPVATATKTRRTPRVARPLTFTIVWFVATLIGSVAMLALQQVTGLSVDAFPLVMAAPTLAVPIAWVICGRPTFLRTPRTDRRTFTRMMVASVAFTALAYLGMAAYAGRFGSLPTVAGLSVFGLIAVQLVCGLLEEIGYKGVLYTFLTHRYRTGVAIVIQGIIFGLIHMQYWSTGPLGVLVFLVGTSGLVAVIPAVWHGSFSQRMLAAGVMHGGVNLACSCFTLRPETFLVAFTVGIWAGAIPVLLARRWIAGR